ncbi:STAS/SEC14 domain-containing protein [Hymenobacter sp. BT683]|uniref:STAS/SEC14 domain-containing protein n=1 Tax=Hymenobacter jeongseonensis TaxID=2791027 RepID=A0ABS0IMX8_9BACT|nr:STAS/SEC14 domain-containing protein [Hymenobacter jeongseonensis]
MYYRNPLGSITYDPLGFVALKWSDAPVTSAELQSLYAHTLQALRYHETCKLLTDQTDRQALSEEMQTWIVEQSIPQAIADCAYSHCAIVECSREDHRQAARAVGSRLTGPLEFRYFEQESDARQWLQST